MSKFGKCLGYTGTPCPNCGRYRIELYENNKDKFVFFNKMKSPIKRLKNKYRYQILMRLKGKNDQLRNEIFKIAHSVDLVNCVLSIEENPSNMS